MSLLTVSRTLPRAERRKKREAERKADNDEAMIDFSNLQNPAEMQAIFTKELSKGEELLEAGSLNNVRNE